MPFKYVVKATLFDMDIGYFDMDIGYRYIDSDYGCSHGNLTLYSVNDDYYNNFGKTANCCRNIIFLIGS
jgi:hypothetical protein